MKRLSPIRKCFSHRSLPLCLASQRTSISSWSTTLFTILFRIQLASELILSRVALCGTASAQLDDAPSHLSRWRGGRFACYAPHVMPQRSAFHCGSRTCSFSKYRKTNSLQMSEKIEFP